MDALTPICGGLILCTLAALAVRAVFGNAPAGASVKVHQAKTAPFVYYPTSGEQPYGMGAVDEDPFDRHNGPAMTHAPDSRALSLKDVNCYPPLPVTSKGPPAFAGGGKAYDLTQADPFAVEIEEANR